MGDAAAGTDALIASVAGAALDAILQPLGVEQRDGGQLGAGQSAVIFMCVAFPGDMPVPARIAHRVSLSDGFAAGPAISTRHTVVQALSPPVSGEGWLAANSPSVHSHHRIGLFVAGGLAQISCRHALDWKIVKGGAEYSGDALDASSYYAHGKDVLAVADGTVVLTQDGLPDNVPRTPAGFQTAIPSTMQNLAENSG